MLEKRSNNQRTGSRGRRRSKHNKNKRRLFTLVIMCISLFWITGLWNNSPADANILVEENSVITTVIKNQEISVEEEIPLDEIQIPIREDKSATEKNSDKVARRGETTPPARTIDLSKKEEQVPTNKNFSDSNLSSILILVNKTIGLPSSYKPDDLTVPNVRFSFEGPHEKQNMRQVAAQALEELFNAAEKEGVYLFAVSGFRSYDRQRAVYNNHVQNLGQSQADKVSAKPGHSEHQTGLAMDITSQSAGFSLSEEFGNTTEGKWVAENAYRYGFIMRYQKGKEYLTGYSYEPWHLRYVGKDAAKEIFEKNLTLEEYLSF